MWATHLRCAGKSVGQSGYLRGFEIHGAVDGRRGKGWREKKREERKEGGQGGGWGGGPHSTNRKTGHIACVFAIRGSPRGIRSGRNGGGDGGAERRVAAGERAAALFREELRVGVVGRVACDGLAAGGEAAEEGAAGCAEGAGVVDLGLDGEGGVGADLLGEGVFVRVVGLFERGGGTYGTGRGAEDGGWVGGCGCG